MTTDLINAGTRVRFTVCFGRMQAPVRLHGVVVTTYGRAFADVLFEGAPAVTKVATCDLTRRSADVVSIRQQAERDAFEPQPAA